MAGVPMCHVVTWAQVTSERQKKMPVAITLFFFVYIPSSSPSSSCCSWAGVCDAKNVPSLTFTVRTSNNSEQTIPLYSEIYCLYRQDQTCDLWCHEIPQLPIVSKLLQFFINRLFCSHNSSLCNGSRWNQQSVSTLASILYIDFIFYSLQASFVLC